MAPTRRGGRPGNNWTCARKRKLVRLYSFTTLSIEDIRIVLQEDGFNPCIRDYKKQLKDLFPRDYSNAQEWRRYRPSDDANARSRFGPLRACKGSRITKARSSQTRSGRKPRGFSGYRAPVDTNGFAHSMSPWFDPLSKYSGSSTVPGSYVSPKALHVTEVANDSLLDDQWPISFPDDDKGTKANSGRNILSGERGQKCDSSSDSGGGGISELHSLSPASSINLEGSQNGSTEISLQNDVSKLHLMPPSHLRQQRDSAMLIKSKSSSPPKTLNVQSLQRRLVGRVCLESIGHINSVLRYSSSNSWRSSIVSLASSWKSRGSSRRNRESIADDRSESTDSGIPCEQMSWNEFIDETQLAPSTQARPIHQELSLSLRPCCGRIELIKEDCLACGYSVTHDNGRHCVEIIDLDLGAYMLPYLVGGRDYFGNTPLHFAAASARITTTALKTIILGGVDIRARNTSGENFMHVLNVTGLGGVAEYLDLLRFLENIDFSFLDRDIHGRTIGHKFFEAVQLEKIDINQLGEIFSRLRVDFSAVDNLGYDFGLNELISSWKSVVEVDENNADAEQKLTLCQAHSDLKYQRVDYRSMLGRRIIKSFPETIGMRSLAKWVDINGDTPLTALVKYWPETEDERPLLDMVHSLVVGGCDLHARDRQGCTALDVATSRGLRPAVTCLIDLGANVNTRNYRGMSILSRATTESLQRAQREGFMRRYGKIVSCISLITDCEARMEPSVYDEFGTWKPKPVSAPPRSCQNSRPVVRSLDI